MIRFFNIRSGQTLEADTEEKIAALWASSDRSPNVSQGQDMGWRMHPEVVVELKKLKLQPRAIKEIAADIQKLPEEIQEYDLLTYLSRRYDADNAPTADQSDYQDEYDAEIRRLSEAEFARIQAESRPVTALAPAPTTTVDLATLGTEQLEAILAARRAADVAAQPTTTTTTTAPATTTTTTKRKESK